MSTKWSFKYVSAACPELTKAEIEVLIEQLYSDSRYESATKSSIQELAQQMFPDTYRWKEEKKQIFLTSHQFRALKTEKRRKTKAIQEAVELLQRADQILAEVVVGASDEVARSQLDLRSNIRFLNKEIGSRDERAPISRKLDPYVFQLHSNE
ncbi:MAG: hypothetical protein CM15mV86_510 [uncultured marine virus]|nr:MAG: hypothetical protein CM15mV86_510 [uncultured marine virus]